MPDETASDREQRLVRIVVETVVRPSFQRCCAHGSEIFDTFYANLSDQLPGVGAMFARTDMRKQNALIREGIVALIDFAANDGTARAELERLGDLHGRRQLDIRPDMYDGWVDALMQMVAEYDAERTDEIEAAWREIVAPGIALMKSRY